jgi:hypothetical protein
MNAVELAVTKRDSFAAAADDPAVRELPILERHVREIGSRERKVVI